MVAAGGVHAEPRHILAPKFAFALKADKVLVTKGDRRLYLLRADKVIRVYRIALGWNPSGPKLREGDGRTPEGLYWLDRRNPNSAFYRSIHISYPTPADLERARERRVSPGGDIMIHGLSEERRRLGRNHVRQDWTWGCIAVTDREMDEIWALVDDGTPIEILP